MSFIMRIIGGPSRSLGIEALAGEVYAPDEPGTGPPEEPGAPEEGSSRPKRRASRAKQQTSRPKQRASRPEPESGPPEPESRPPEPPGPPEPGSGQPGERVAFGGITGVEGTIAGREGLGGGGLGIGVATAGFAGGFRPTPLPPIPLATVTTQPSTVFVEVGAAAEQAAISRNGVQVPIVQINPATLQTALGNTVVLPARVVSQSIAPGVSVAKGTSVDVTLTEPTKLNVGILKNPFQPLVEQPLDAVYTTFIRDNPGVQSVLARNTTGAALNQADQATLTEALGTANPVTTTPGQTIDAAFDTLQAAFTFGT